MIFCLSVLFAPRCEAHKLEDGFVERAVQIVVRDQTATVTYFLGLNENTQADVFAELTKAASPTKGEAVDDDKHALLLAHLARGLNVNIGQNRVSVKPLKLEPSAKHHFAFVASMEFPLPVSKSSEITVKDENFSELDGAARYSIKALGSAMILKSNAAPIIIRAKRHELGALDAQQRSEVCCVAATVAISQHPKTEQ